MNRGILQVRRSMAAIGLAAALLIGGALGWAFTSDTPVLGAARAITLSVAPEAQGTAGSLTAGFADVVEPILPAVVNISTSRNVQRTRQQQQPNPFSDDPFFRRFFGDPFGPDQQPDRRQRGMGSGVIVSPEGSILTNNHVIEDASEINVLLNDKREFQAKLIGADPRSDLAVIQIQAPNLTVLKLGDSSKLRVGDIVLAIGNPFGLDETVTMGIVSATGRRNTAIMPEGGYGDFIQTDAAINPGNSGGALVNARGELVGINTSIYSGTGGNLGIGFAIPVNMARGVMEQIMKTGRVSRGYLGIMIQPLTNDLATAFSLPSSAGALVGDVTADSPAARAGIEKGDAIVALNGQPVADYQDLRLRVSQIAPGTRVTLDLFRGGQKRQVTVTLAELPESVGRANVPVVPESSENALEGLQVSSLTPAIAQQLDLPADVRGVVVSGVDPNSTSAEAGLQRGDVIQEVNRSPVTNLEQFRAAVRAGGNRPILMLVNRQGQTQYVVVSQQ
jgi:Do/DeqQ family serine protease